ncbi:MAG: HlyD family efflux transporter periplasmic adaptor subunit [Planctomycetales bacterium]|nr:HlyD family efflux transporter periplasmic adaptor subunit [Planctomycetales bacterium]
MKRVKTKLPWILVAAALAGLLVYGFWPEPVHVETARVLRGPVQVTVNDDGETRIREKYVVSAPVGGKLLRVQLEAGDRVARGETELARIEPGDPALLDARTQAESQARLRAAEAALERARTLVKHAEEAAELAEHDFQRAKSLLPQRAISKSEYDTLEHQYRISAADVRSANFGVNVAQFELEQAQAAAARYVAAENGDNPASFQLISPIDGNVLRVIQEDASVVAPGAAILELGDPRDLEIQIDVLSNDAVNVRPGQKVLIEHWGGEQPLQAIVRTVEPSAFLKISALGVEEKRVYVIADFIDPWSERQTLGDGFRIEARIVVESTDEQGLKAPAGALFRDGDQWHAYRVVAGRAERCVVETGPSNGEETTILNGLSEHDTVIMHPTSSVQDGIRVVFDQ